MSRRPPGGGKLYNTPFRNAPAAGTLRVHTSAERMFPLRLILRMKLLVIVAVEVLERFQSYALRGKVCSQVRRRTRFDPLADRLTTTQKPIQQVMT